MQVSRPQSYLRFPLTHLFATSGHVRVLRALVAFGAPLSAGQLAADAGMSPRGVRFVLDNLVSQGLVSVLGQARSQLFVLASGHPFLGVVEALFQHEARHWQETQDALRAQLTAWPEVQAAWLYGSVARGEDLPRSDVDVALLVTDEGVEASHRIRDALQGLGDHLHMNLSATVLGPADLAAIPPDDPWWANLVREAKVLKGSAPARERELAQRRAQASA